MVLHIETPPHAGARDQARGLVAPLALELAGHEVVLDCAPLVVGTPSFFDEILKLVLVERRADLLDVRGASTRVRQLLERAAENRGVPDRLAFAVRS